MDRFVVLHHKMPNESPRGDHWDLMLRNGDVLLTWALDKLPGRNTTCAGRRLPDHDIKYLEYEGSISGGRGSVTRVIEGQYRWLSDQESVGWIAELVAADRQWTMTIDCIDKATCEIKFE